MRIVGYVCVCMCKWAIYIRRTWKSFYSCGTICLNAYAKWQKQSQKLMCGICVCFNRRENREKTTEALKKRVPFTWNNHIKWYVSVFNRTKFQTNYSLRIPNQFERLTFLIVFWHILRACVCVCVYANTYLLASFSILLYHILSISNNAILCFIAALANLKWPTYE